MGLRGKASDLGEKRNRKTRNTYAKKKKREQLGKKWQKMMEIEAISPDRPQKGAPLGGKEFQLERERSGRGKTKTRRGKGEESVEFEIRSSKLGNFRPNRAFRKQSTDRESENGNKFETTTSIRKRKNRMEGDRGGKVRLSRVGDWDQDIISSTATSSSEEQKISIEARRGKAST